MDDDHVIEISIPTRTDDQATTCMSRDQRYGPIYEDDWAPDLLSLKENCVRLGKEPKFMVYLIDSIEWCAELKLIAETLDQVREWNQTRPRGGFDVAGYALMAWKDRHPDSSKLAYMTRGDLKSLEIIPWKVLETCEDDDG